MIPQVTWSHGNVGHPGSPFASGPDQRPIRLTLHDESYAGAEAEQAQAVTLLRELAFLPEVDVIDTAPGCPAHLQIGYDETEKRLIPVRVVSAKSQTYSGVETPGWLSGPHSRTAGRERPQHEQFQYSFRDEVLAEAHRRLQRDILVTLAPHLLGDRNKGILRHANPRTPVEAAKIVGLFLRGRDNFTYVARDGGRGSLDRGLFYWVLARHRLPSMWRYFSACTVAAATRSTDVRDLGSSILVRCVRALEARDAIGAQFYLPQGNGTRDAMMYHFDYLTLLLAGALDAQARVAARVYGIAKPPERYVGFRHRDFLTALKKAGATKLHEIVTGEPFNDLMTLLYELRNTIHSAGLPTIAYMPSSGSQRSLVRVKSEQAMLIWAAAARRGPRDRWGIWQAADAWFEPYTYSVALVEDCLGQIDEIAGVTDVARLNPGASDSPGLLDAPPNDSVFREDVRERVALLG